MEIYPTNLLGITITARVGQQSWVTLGPSQGADFVVTTSESLQIIPMSDVDQEVSLKLWTMKR